MFALHHLYVFSVSLISILHEASFISLPQFLSPTVSNFIFWAFSLVSNADLFLASCLITEFVYFIKKCPFILMVLFRKGDLNPQQFGQTRDFMRLVFIFSHLQMKGCCEVTTLPSQQEVSFIESFNGNRKLYLSPFIECNGPTHLSICHPRAVHKRKKS